MAEEYHIAADYLVYTEAASLHQRLLNEAEVVSVIKSCGPPTFPYGEGMYYRVLVRQKDLERSQEIINEFSENRKKVIPPTCPNCGSTEVMPIENKNIFKKIFYAGTQLYKCVNCRKEFFV